MIKAHAFNDFNSFGVAVAFTLETEEGSRRVARFENGRLAAFEPHTPNAVVEPNLVLDDGMGRALLDALAAHYHGIEDTRSLRRDYDAERARVDKLIGGLASIADKLVSP